MQVVDVPILVSALVFAGLAVIAWRHAPLCARIILGVATVFAYTALQYPGMSIEEVLGQTNDGLTYLVAAARISGFAAAMLAVTLMLRDWATRSEGAGPQRARWCGRSVSERLVDPSGAMCQRGLCATSQGWPSGSTNTPE